jgi:DNA-binding transcriptional MocR family regulator
LYAVQLYSKDHCTAPLNKTRQDAAGQALYLKVAGELAAMIAGGQLLPQERVPSVRALSRQRRISATTAIASLRSLERRGLIEARPQSGYFVARRKPQLAEPAQARASRTVRQVGVKALLSRLFDANLDPTVARLGQAIPDASLFPQRPLRRELLNATRADPQLLTDYEFRVAGSASLRHEIARHYAHLGARLDEEELLVTNGCMEALNLAVRAVARPGDTIAVESPTYFGFLQIVEAQGVKVVEIPAHPRDGLSVEALRDLLASRAGKSVRACMVIGNFSNPTGATLPERRKRELLQLCREADIALIEDDIYGDLQHSGPRPLPCKAFDTDGRVLLCSSFSKSLAPGARIGFIAGGRYSEEIRAAKFVASIATAPLQQEMIARYLRAGRYDRHLLRVRRAFAEQLERVSQIVDATFPAGTRVTRPQGGFVLWVELDGDIDTMQLYERARRAGVDFVPGALFSAAGNYRNCMRLNCGLLVTPAVEAAVTRLGNLVKTRS